MIGMDATVLFEDFLKSLKEWNEAPLKSFVTSLGFDYNEVTQESDTHATFVKDEITYSFYAYNDEAALNIINNKEHIVMDQIYFKFVEGEWVEED